MIPRVYTAVVGDYAKRTDIECFTGDGIFTRPVMEAKRYKILPHLFFHDDITIWVDCNIWLTQSPTLVADALLGTADMAVFSHPYRKTVWEEFLTLRDDPRFAIPYLQQQLKRQAQDYGWLSDDTPLYECSILIRRNSPKVRRAMEAWWAQICRYQWRDQVSLPYVLATHDIKVNAIQGNARNHPLFRHVEQWPTATSA